MDSLFCRQFLGKVQEKRKKYFFGNSRIPVVKKYRVSFFRNLGITGVGIRQKISFCRKVLPNDHCVVVFDVDAVVVVVAAVM